MVLSAYWSRCRTTGGELFSHTPILLIMDTLRHHHHEEHTRGICGVEGGRCCDDVRIKPSGIHAKLVFEHMKHHRIP